MLIVDAQIHLWNAGNPTSPWHRQIPAYLKEDALKEMAAGGVDAAILTPHTAWDPNANERCTQVYLESRGTAGSGSARRSPRVLFDRTPRPPPIDAPGARSTDRDTLPTS